MSTLKSVIIQYSDSARQWRAHFDGAPQVVFGSDIPMAAVSRLLTVSKSPGGEYELRCDQDQAGGEQLVRVATWQPKPPELLFECSDCAGTGKQAAPKETETCPACRGRKVVAA